MPKVHKRIKKIKEDGKLWGKGRVGKGKSAQLKWNAKISFNLMGKEVTESIENATLDAASYVNTARRALGLGLVERAGGRVIAVNKLRSIVEEGGLQQKSCAKIQELYNVAVYDKFIKGGSSFNAWFPLAKSTIKRRLRAGITTKRPLFATGTMREAINDKFIVTNLNLWNETQLKGNKFQFRNIRVNMAMNNGGKPPYGHGNFASFREMVQHQSRWRNIPLSVGKAGEQVGGAHRVWVGKKSSGASTGRWDLVNTPRETLARKDVTRGEFAFFVWKPFLKWWKKELLGALKAAHPPTRLPHELVQMVKKTGKQIEKELGKGSKDTGSAKIKVPRISESEMRALLVKEGAPKDWVEKLSTEMVNELYAQAITDEGGEDVPYD